MGKMLAVGKICNTHGVRGNIKLIPWTDFPEVFEDIDYITVENIRYDIKDVKYQKSNIILKLQGIDTVEEAEKLRDLTAYCEVTQLEELPEDTYYIADLIGCEV
ncbi:MAG: 16S rRNA processing protein RimM, partial [Clostridia bacterium]|nr:16S rRNA processing protein RimM [Clostridia bacterium]